MDGDDEHDREDVGEGVGAGASASSSAPAGGDDVDPGAHGEGGWRSEGESTARRHGHEGKSSDSLEGDAEKAAYRTAKAGEAARSKFASLRSKSQVSFLQGQHHKDNPTREQMIEYISLQAWSRKACMSAPLPLSLWVSLLVLVIVHAHSEASYRVQAALAAHVQNITADMTRGVPPDRTFSAGLKEAVSCKCACALQTDDSLCRRPDGRAKFFESTITVQQLAILRTRASYNQTIAEQAGTLRWHQLQGIPDVWFWVQHGLVPDLWHEAPRSTAVTLADYFGSNLSAAPPAANTSKNNAGIVLQWHQIIGGVRLRTMRWQPQSCGINTDITDRYNAHCHGTDPELMPFGPGVMSYTEGFMPNPNFPGAFDAYLDLVYPARVAAEKVQYSLQAHDWIDSSTSELHIQAAFLNAEADPPFFGLLEVSFNFEKSGGLATHVTVGTVMAKPFASPLEIAVDIIWLVLAFGLFGMRSSQLLSHFVARTKQREKDANLCDIWVFLDWLTILASFALAANLALLYAETGYAGERVAGLPLAPDLDTLTKEALRQYHEQWDAVLDQIIALVNWGDGNRLYLFWYVLLATLDVMQIFRGQPKLAQLAEVFKHAAGDLLHYMLLFVVLFLTFAFGGYLIWGLSLESWSSSMRSVNTCFRILLGTMDLDGMYEVAPFSTVVWCALFFTAMIFLMLNLLLAIEVDNFATVKVKVGSSTGVFSQVWALMQDIAARGARQVLPRRHKDPAFPSHRLLLNELMFRAGFDRDSRHQVRGSVIGCKQQKKGLERRAFTGEARGALGAAALAKADCIPDLRELGLDEEYIEALVEGCKTHIAREYDPTEMQLNQFRELVNIAEDDLLAMRQRIYQCQEYAGDSLKYLAYRLECLEHAVHRSLEHLVKLADGAGVSTKGQPPASVSRRAQLESTMTGLRSLDPAVRTKVMFSGSVKGVLEHLASPTSGDPTAASSSGAPAPRATPKGKTGISDWHRADKKVEPRGKHLLHSARDDWRHR